MLLSFLHWHLLLVVKYFHTHSQSRRESPVRTQDTDEKVFIVACGTKLTTEKEPSAPPRPNVQVRTPKSSITWANMPLTFAASPSVTPVRESRAFHQDQPGRRWLLTWLTANMVVLWSFWTPVSVTAAGAVFWRVSAVFVKGCLFIEISCNDEGPAPELSCFVHEDDHNVHYKQAEQQPLLLKQQKAAYRSQVSCDSRAAKVLGRLSNKVTSVSAWFPV